MDVEIKVIYTKKEDILKIFSKLNEYSFEALKKHEHLEFSIMEKLTDLEIIKSTFPKYDLIKSIEFRENSKKEEYYGFNYELIDGTYVIISISFNTKPPTIINAFHVNRSYKQFEKSLRKNYGKKFV